MNELTLTEFLGNLIDRELKIVVIDDKTVAVIKKTDNILTKTFNKVCPISTRRSERNEFEKTWVTERLKTYIKNLQNFNYFLRQKKFIESM